MNIIPITVNKSIPRTWPRRRLALRHEFQRSTPGEQRAGNEQTTGGFWINRFALQSSAEATADAFALWIVLYHTTNPQPVFWLKPEDTDYELIAGVMDGVLNGLDIGIMIR